MYLTLALLSVYFISQANIEGLVLLIMGWGGKVEGPEFQANSKKTTSYYTSFRCEYRKKYVNDQISYKYVLAAGVRKPDTLQHFEIWARSAEYLYLLAG